MLVWKLRCIAAWMCRAVGVVVAFYLSVVLLPAYETDPTTFQEVFPLGIAEILVVGLSSLAAFDLLGRLISWTNPKNPLPRFRDRAR
jgi:hypothetical protein